MLLAAKNLENHTDLFARKLKQIEPQKLITDIPHSENFARLMKMSKSALYQKMKLSTGLTPFEYLREMQNKHALEMLSDDTYNISEIACKIGFNDPQYFSRYFRSKFGLSPKMYRELSRNGRYNNVKNNSFLEKVNSIIEANQKVEDYNMDAFAVDMRMSKSTLSRRLKEATGCSPWEYIQVVRIKNANKLLKTSDADLMDVANAVGFRDVKYFSRCFKDQYGKYPAQIIKERQLNRAG
jgi:AraC-like DNA-binding protein